MNKRGSKKGFAVGAADEYKRGAINRQRSLDELDSLINFFLEKNSISYDEVINLLKEKTSNESIVSIPLFYFRMRAFSPLQIIVFYLVEEKKMPIKEISSILHKRSSVVEKSYNEAKLINIRLGSFLSQENNNGHNSLMIPLLIFSNPYLSPMESLIKYLKDDKKLKYNEIARLLNRDARTIWTAYHRAKYKVIFLLENPISIKQAKSEVKSEIMSQVIPEINSEVNSIQVKQDPNQIISSSYDLSQNNLRLNKPSNIKTNAKSNHAKPKVLI